MTSSCQSWSHVCSRLIGSKVAPCSIWAEISEHSLKVFYYCRLWRSHPWAPSVGCILAYYKLFNADKKAVLASGIWSCPFHTIISWGQWSFSLSVLVFHCPPLPITNEVVLGHFIYISLNQWQWYCPSWSSTWRCNLKVSWTKTKLVHLVSFHFLSWPQR